MHNLLTAERCCFVFQEERATHLLFSFLEVEKHEFIIREATFGESQADTVGVGRTASAVQCKSWHFRAAQ